MTDAEARLAQQHRVWEDWAQADPLWAIASVPELRGGQWDTTEFFATGRTDVAALLGQIRAHGIELGSARCLDFGCGVGRLTQALAHEFDRADGVDVSESMIEQADRYNTLGERAVFHLNVSNDLSLFDDAVFDLVFTTMVLQHINPVDALGYVEEFVRVLRSGGTAVFDAPERTLFRPMPEGGHRARLQVRTVPDLVDGAVADVVVDVTNTSEVTWPGSMSIRVGNSWLEHGSGDIAVRDDARVALLEPVGPGETTTVTLKVTPPGAGRWVLAVDCVEEGVAWFGDVGSQRVEQRVKVAKPPRRRRGDAGEGAPAPVMFSMNAISRDEVAAAVTRAGGRVVAHEPTHTAGPEWEAYRYFVTKD